MILVLYFLIISNLFTSQIFALENETLHNTITPGSGNNLSENVVDKSKSETVLSMINHFIDRLLLYMKGIPKFIIWTVDTIERSLPKNLENSKEMASRIPGKMLFQHIKSIFQCVKNNLKDFQRSAQSAKSKRENRDYLIPVENVEAVFSPIVKPIRAFFGQLIVTYLNFTPEIRLINCLSHYYESLKEAPQSGAIGRNINEEEGIPFRIVKFLIHIFTENKFSNSNSVNNDKLKSIENFSSSSIPPSATFTGRAAAVQIVKDIQEEFPSVNETKITPNKFTEFIKDLFNFDDIIQEKFGLVEVNHAGMTIKVKRPTKCIKIYIIDSLWRMIEKYLLG